MARDLRDLERELAELGPKDKASLVRMLIDSLDEEADEDAERLWLEEAERRYAAYRRGDATSRPAEEVFARARKRFRT